ncbi:hypothetical protein KUCAC02_034189, partial [Chaenocephalus aceratus]
MALSQALSEEEFHRMQYANMLASTGQITGSQRELNAVRQKNAVLERDFVKAQKALNKSKKAQEVEALLSENEMLQGKLHSQEEDFRLQNSTLMTELSKIEELEQENQGLKDGAASAPSPPPNPTSSPVDGELLRLQAENSTLLKKMKTLQERFDMEQQRQPVAEGNQNAAMETASANGVSDATGKGEEPTSEGANERLEQKEAQLEHKEKQLHDSPLLCAAPPLGLSEKSVEKIVAKQAAIGWSAALCPITHCFGPELEMALNTEQEEKRLLREQIHALEASKQAEITKLQEEITKLTDKLKKKQESFQRLQGEKEALYNDSRTKIDEINQRKEEELKATNIRIQKLQSDVLAANQVTGELREQLQSKEKEHELALHILRDQVANQSAVSQEQVDSILQENDALRTNLAALEQENSALRTNLSALEQIQTVKTQEMNLLREQQEALTLDLQQKTSRAGESSEPEGRPGLTAAGVEFCHRKLLEQLTEEGQERTNCSKIWTVQEDKNRSEEEIRQQLRDEKARSKALEGLQQRVEELQAQVLSMEGTKGWFERRLKEAEENIEKKTLEHQEEVERLQKEHTLQLEGSGSGFWFCFRVLVQGSASGFCFRVLGSGSGFFFWVLLLGSGSGFWFRFCFWVLVQGFCFWVLVQGSGSGFCFWVLLQGSGSGFCFRVLVQGSGSGFCFRVLVQGSASGFRVLLLGSGSGFRVLLQGSGSGFCFWVLVQVLLLGSGSGFCFRVLASGFRVLLQGSGFCFRVQGDKGHCGRAEDLEKKGSAADLKRQLQLERKRADKLQERLQEILTNSKTRTGLEELVLSEINSPVESAHWRLVLSLLLLLQRHDEGVPADQSEQVWRRQPSVSASGRELSDDEVGELFQRLAEVQQEKWMLEEKDVYKVKQTFTLSSCNVSALVKHLEVSCSSMAEDICRKSSIIETYVMDSRIARLTGSGLLRSVDCQLSANITFILSLQREWKSLKSKLRELLIDSAGDTQSSSRFLGFSGGAVGGHGGHGGHGGVLAERGGLGSVLRDLVKPGDENLREMNKKLQNMLEEQLTKNMHLQKLESLGWAQTNTWKQHFFLFILCVCDLRPVLKGVEEETKDKTGME